MTRKTFTALALMGSAALVLSGCSGSSPDPVEPAPDGDSGNSVVETLVSQGVSEDLAGQLNDLYEEALKGDTTIDFYGLMAAPLADTFENFQKTFPGLTVAATQLNTPDTITRVTAEASSGQILGDLVSGVPEVFAPITEYLQKVTPLDVENVSELAHDPAGFYGNAFTPYSPVVNTSVKSKVPTTWKGLVTGGFDGSIAAVDPSVVGLTSAMLTWLLEYDIIKEADLKTFAASDVTFFPESGSSTTAIGTMEKDIMFNNSYSVFAAQAAAGGFDNLEFFFPMDDINLVATYFLAVPEGAQNQAASELLLNYLFTVPAQESAAELGFIPTLNGVGSEVVPPVADIPNIQPTPGIEKTGEVFARWSSVLSSAFGG